jgi:hypothetical protein
MVFGNPARIAHGPIMTSSAPEQTALGGYISMLVHTLAGSDVLLAPLLEYSPLPAKYSCDYVSKEATRRCPRTQWRP